jgi:hypothetical protein
MPHIINGVEFKTWDEMSELEKCQSHYSDFHKEAYGFRPRHSTEGWTVEDFNREFARFAQICKENEKARKESEGRAVIEFEALCVKLVTRNGVKDRAAAIRHLADAEGVGEDMEFLCYLLGLPYGYFAPKG